MEILSYINKKKPLFCEPKSNGDLLLRSENRGLTPNALIEKISVFLSLFFSHYPFVFEFSIVTFLSLIYFFSTSLIHLIFQLNTLNQTQQPNGVHKQP